MVAQAVTRLGLGLEYYPRLLYGTKYENCYKCVFDIDCIGMNVYE